MAFVEAAVAIRTERSVLIRGVGRFSELFGVHVSAQVTGLGRSAFVIPTTRDLAAVHTRGDEVLMLTEGDHFWGEIIAWDVARVLHVRED